MSNTKAKAREKRDGEGAVVRMEYMTREERRREREGGAHTLPCRYVRRNKAAAAAAGGEKEKRREKRREETIL